jgi:catechol 2,3-dioxygenase-like lactoylglutathione lyase family enzyme
MPKLIGPDFIALQTEDLAAARSFYGDRLGLPVVTETPEVVVFGSKPVPFAVRTPMVDLAAAQGKLGWGIALWFGSDDPQALHDMLAGEEDVQILSAPKPGPFGLHFAFRDPFGYVITVHAA